MTGSLNFPAFSGHRLVILLGCSLVWDTIKSTLKKSPGGFLCVRLQPQILKPRVWEQLRKKELDPRPGKVRQLRGGECVRGWGLLSRGLANFTVRAAIVRRVRR